MFNTLSNVIICAHVLYVMDGVRYLEADIMYRVRIVGDDVLDRFRYVEEAQ
jgi:hypothetical protein